jgi:hypothetical protein
VVLVAARWLACQVLMDVKARLCEHLGAKAPAPRAACDLPTTVV